MEESSQAKNNPEFIKATMGWAQIALQPINRAYSGLHRSLSNGHRANKWLVDDHFLFFVLAVLGILLLSPKYIVLMQFVLDKYLFQMSIAKPDTSYLPYVPNILFAGAVVSLFTFFLNPQRRLVVLGFILLPLSVVVDRNFDVVSFAVFLVFLALVYGVIKLPLRRSIVVGVICLLSVTFLFLCKTWTITSQRAITGIAMFQMALVPMLWYSAYEHLPPKRRLDPMRFLIFNCCRILNAPIMMYKDIFGKPTQSISQIRFNGIKAIYVALFGAIGIWGINTFADGGEISSSKGFSLLFMSYLFYLKAYLKTMIGFNIFIGIARMFGVPIRDNFHYWLLARTPNEHWRRWNILAREWIVTFVFFPIMRSKQWLFVAIMAALLTSGLLHAIYLFFEKEMDWFSLGTTFLYWTMNGLSIYLVLKIPLIYPKLMDRLKISNKSKGWSAVGIVLTSAFYAVLISACSSRNWNELGSYFSRLFSF
jgi:hypothetical protein